MIYQELRLEVNIYFMLKGINMHTLILIYNIFLSSAT